MHIAATKRFAALTLELRQRSPMTFCPIDHSGMKEFRIFTREVRSDHEIVSEIGHCGVIVNEL